MSKSTIQVPCTFREMLASKESDTSSIPEFQLKPIEVLMLELEDVLFHLDSAVMMPERPQGRSSTDGDEDDATDPDDAKVKADQDKVSGLQAIALAFKQFEFDPDKRLLITGHTDTSGADKMNFELSAQRAENVLHLIEGNRESWAEVSQKRHRIEDYQQILMFVKDHRNWTDCDPHKIDNAWSDDVGTATENFIKHYKYWILSGLAPEGSEPIPEGTYERIKKDSAHKWPLEMWRAVYDLYNEEIALALGATRDDLAKYRAPIQYCDPKHKYVACGESYLIDDAEKENYRSQVNRRVELFFFDADDIPVIDCPPRVDSKHKAPECPMWHRFHFKRVYADGADLNAQAYHLKFLYYDRMLQKQTEVTDGLSIAAFSDPAESTESDLKARCSYRKGVYWVKVKKDASRRHIHFRFERKDNAKDMWVYTEKKDGTPKFLEKPKAELEQEITNLAKTSAAQAANERIKYYDLPALWNSRNWSCAVKDVVKDFADYMLQKTTPKEAIVFNLDDIALVDSAGKQTITDRSGEAGGDGKGKPKPLSVTSSPTANPPEYPSRVRILFVDSEKNKLALHMTKASGTAADRYTSSQIYFQKDSAGKAKNLIKDPPGQSRAVIFCHELYDVAARRTDTSGGTNLNAGHLLGARAAMLNDTPIHSHKRVRYDDPYVLMHSPGIGDFELHYLHGGGVDADKAYSYLVVFWSAGFAKDTKPTVGGTGDNRPATDAEVEKSRSAGMLNSMDHWNKKEYQFEDNEAKSSHVIRPFYMFDANETFNLAQPNPAVDFEKDTDTLYGTAEFTTALQNTRGGIPLTIAFVTEEDKGSWMMSWRGVDKPFSIMSLRIKTCEDDSTRFSAGSMNSGVVFPYSEFGDPTSYGCLAMAHEIGHATGQIDDYQENAKHQNKTMGVPNYGQWGVKADGTDVRADNTDFANRVLSSEAWALKIHPHDKTMMEKNGAIRARHVWRFTHWLNEEGKAGKPLEKFLSKVQFKLHYPHPSPVIDYFRDTTVKQNPWALSHSARLDVKPPTGADTRKMNAYLYRVLDESGRTARLSGADSGSDVHFRGILVVRPLLSISFVRHNGHVWTTRQMTDWLRLFHTLFSKGGNYLHNKYLLTGGGGDFDPTLIHFLPGYDFYNEGGAPAHANFNFRVDITWDTNTFARAGDIISMGDDESRVKELFFYLFNKPSTAAGFTTGDFDFIKTWFSGPAVANAGFRIEEV